MPTLDWLNRANAFTTANRVPYRLLEQVSTHGAPANDNLLIQGDNLEALKAYQQSVLTARTAVDKAAQIRAPSQ